MNIEIVDTIPQRSAEWFAQRLGKLTGSRFDDLMKQGRGKDALWGETALSLLKEKACEILTGEIVPIPTNWDMQWGIDHEPQAIEAFELSTGLEVSECGFFQIVEYSGASPDGIVSNNRILETKCPSSRVHFGYYLDNESFIKAYKWQVNGEILAADAEGAYLVSYDPRMPPSHQLVIVEIERNEDEMNQLRERIELGAEMIQEWVK